MIENLAFIGTSIEKIILPPSVTRICEEAFSGCRKLRIIETTEDSNLQTIERNAFKYSTIKSLSITSKFSFFNDGWCYGVSELTEIKIAKNNQKYSLYDD